MPKISLRIQGMLVFALLTSWESSLADELSPVFIVNSENPISSLSPEQVTDYYLKNKRQWPDGSAVRFIDHNDSSPERSEFLKKVIKKSDREVDLHWIGQKLHSGDSAPAQVASDAMMASLVARFRGAIGYVSRKFPGAKGVKKLEVMGLQ